MTNTEKKTQKDAQNNPQAKNEKGIKNHRKAASNFTAAAKIHLEAAKHHEDHNHDLAAKSTVEALSFSDRARKALEADVKQHTTKI
jgi:hypothetical protein